MNALVRIILSACVFSFATPAVAQEPDISRAYKKEFAYLEAQKNALQKRIVEVESQTVSKTRAARSEVDRLQGRIVSLSMRADELEESLSEVRREATAVEERSDTLAGTFELASTTLEGFDVEVKSEAEPDQSAAHIRTIFEEAIGVLDRSQRVRETSGEFFLRDGSKANGQVVEIGRVAAYGVSERASGALAPAGEGRLKLWPAESARSAEMIASGEQPATIDVFLFESLDKQVEEQEGKTWLETIQAGGVIAWVIVVIGLLALLLVVFRTFKLAFASRGVDAFADILSAVRAGEYSRALKAAEDANGPTARVLADTIRNLGKRREVVEDIVSEAILRETPSLERFGNAIMVFAAVSPLLGLLGTVTGMISTFDVITEYGTGDPKMLSGGISEALITTQLGLIVAIPALMLGNLLNSRANTVIDEMEHSALRIVNASGGPGDPGPDGTLAEDEPTIRAIESAAGE